eukprot:TRINITY_DN16110_c0_g1_i1.p1 TRINITY_DN16110_c0_g1~~TRINITY_DN16110_c0_g1_i1.p1  ORF type:complete len:1202 (+),score=192.17 TRINITY_DN16110_c0_g1_i1:167-3772(+)
MLVLYSICVSAAVGALGLPTSAPPAAISPTFVPCWDHFGADADATRTECCGNVHATGCFDELYTRSECCSRGQAMSLPAASRPVLGLVAHEGEMDSDKAAELDEQRRFEAEHREASVMVEGDVFGHRVLLNCFKRSRGSCEAMIVEAKLDQFSLFSRITGPAASGAKVVYIGANHGALLIALAKHFPSAKFVALEPEPVVYRYLVWNIRVNGLSDRVTARNLAIQGADGSGVLRLCVHYGRISRTAPCGQGADHHETVQEVSSVPMSSVLPDSGELALLVLDCEGCEADVFSESHFSSWRPANLHVRRIVGELHYSAFSSVAAARHRIGDRHWEDEHESGTGTTLLSNGLDIAAALEGAARPSVPTRVGRRLWASILGDLLHEDPLHGGAHPAGVEDFQGLRVFVYDLPPRFHADLLREVKIANERTTFPVGSPSNCDYAATPCKETSWSDFYSVVRQLATEVVFLQKILRSPLLVSDPKDADLFVVPYFHALDCRLATFRNEAWQPRCRNSDLPYELWKHLSYYNATTASTHLFLASTEPHNMNLDIAGQPLLLSVGPRLGDQPFGHILVPFLVTEPELQPKAWMASGGADAFDRDVEFLYTGNRGGLWRPRIVTQLEAYREKVGSERVLLGTYLRAEFGDAQVVHKSTGGQKRKAVFCVCPPGDATSATIRFYDALLSGCIPVVVAFPTFDGRVSWFRPGGPPVEWSYAFPKEIRWREAVVEVPVAALRAGKFVETVLAVSQERREAIARYIAEIRTKLVVDWAGSGPDAFSAILRSIAAALKAAQTSHGASAVAESAALAVSEPGQRHQPPPCCTCAWLPGKHMPRAYYRWWTHAFGELYCYTFGHEPPLPRFSAQWQAVAQLRSSLAGAIAEMRGGLGEEAALQIQVVASAVAPRDDPCRSGTYPKDAASLPLWLRLAARPLLTAAVSRWNRSGVAGDSGSSMSAPVGVFLSDVCSNASSIIPLRSAWPSQLVVSMVPFRNFVSTGGQALISDLFGEFEVDEARGDETIRLVVESTRVRSSEPPPSAAFWAHVLAALDGQHPRNSVYVFINTSAVERRPHETARFLLDCLPRVRGQKVSTRVGPLGCLGLVKDATSVGRSPCTTVWRLASGSCTLPEHYDGSMIAVAVLTSELLASLPSATVRSFAMLLTARVSRYEAISDVESGDMLLWLMHFPGAYGSRDERNPAHIHSSFLGAA